MPGRGRTGTHLFEPTGMIENISFPHWLTVITLQAKRKRSSLENGYLCHSVKSLSSLLALLLGVKEPFFG